MKTRTTVTAIWLLAIVISRSTAEPVSFRRDIAPVLLENCVPCHGSKKAESGYRVDTFERAVGEGDSGVPGFTAAAIDDSEAFRRIVSEDVDERMPLEGEALSELQIALLKRWILEGAKFDAPDPKATLLSIIPPPQHSNPPEKYPRTIPVTSLSFNADGSELFVSGYHEVTVWNTNSGQLVRRIRNVDQRTFAMDLSPDCNTLAVASGAPGRRGELRVFDSVSGQLKMVLGSSQDVVLDVKYAPNGKRLATATADSRLLVFDAETGMEQLVVTSHSDWVTAVAWSPDGTKLASASRDKTAKVFDARKGDLIVTYAGHNQTVRGVAFHPDGAEVFSAGADNKIHRWNIADGKKVAEIGFGGEVFRLPLEGSFLFATSADKTVRQYDARTHKEVRQYLGHQDWACSVAFHEATNKVASGGFDGEVRIWDAEDGSQVVAFYAAPGLPAPQSRSASANRSSD